MVLADLFTSFVLGLLTPLTAVCVLPLFPAFLAYLSNQLTGKESRKHLALFGLIVAAGVISFMFLIGLLFTFFLQISLTEVIGVVSPLAFGVLGIISILLILDVDIGQFFPQVHAPVTKNPFLSAFVFGFFFGAIVLPCNPLFIIALFTKTISTNFLVNMANFGLFGIGLSAPLLLFSLLSTTSSKTIISVLTRHKRNINLVSGLFMLVVSIYYLVFVFKVIPIV